MSAPILQAVVLADRVYQDRETGKHVVAGTFNEVTAHEFPCEYAVPVQLYCVLTGVSEPLSIAMRFVATDDHVVMRSSAVTIRCSDPLETIELALPVPSLVLPAAGWYRLEVLLDDTPRGFSRLHVVQV
jgi:hypothetical protein